MRKIILMLFILTSMITIAQKKYHLDIETSLIKKEINLNDEKFHLLTEDILEPFKTINNSKPFLIVQNTNKKINLHLEKIKIKSKKYFFENDFYYNPIIYKF